MAPGMDYIWRHGAANIQIPAPVGSKRKRDNWGQDSGDANDAMESQDIKWERRMGGVSYNMEKLPRQEISVVKTRVRINLWAASHEEKWRRVPTKPE